MGRRDAETQRENQITEGVIGAAIEVHRNLGPGLLEGAYEECMCYELAHSGLRFTRQTSIPVTYKGLKLNRGFRLDLLVEDPVVVEIKAVGAVLPVHEAQLLTYLKLLNRTVGLLINFNEPALKTGIRRVVNNFPESSSASPRLCVEKGRPDAPALP